MSKHPEERIDCVLNALRDTEPPVGLEARILSRVAKAAEANTVLTPRFSGLLNAVRNPRVWSAGVPLYTLAGSTALLLTVFLLVSLSHRNPHTVERAKPLPVPARAYAQARQNSPLQGNPVTRTRRSRTLQPTSSLSPLSVTQADPDAIALAETLTPSHPAPPLPLTQQELLLLKATQKGAPIELAELELANAPAFHAAAEARKEADIKRFAGSLLAPLAISESLQSTTQDADQPPLPPAPPSSPSN